MGRWYRTTEGREGKFAVCKQPSTDPEDFFGLEEQEPNEIEYHASKDQEEDIKNRVDELYDKLGVPKEKRVYYYSGDKPLNDWYDMVEQYAYKKINNAEVKRYEKLLGEKPDQFYCGEEHKTMIEKFDGSSLCMARIKLGITILSDIKDTGECWITAELG